MLLGEFKTSESQNELFVLLSVNMDYVFVNEWIGGACKNKRIQVFIIRVSRIFPYSFARVTK